MVRVAGAKPADDKSLGQDIARLVPQREDHPAPIHHIFEGLAEQGQEALLCLDEAYDVRPQAVRRQRFGVAEERVVLSSLD